MEVWVFLAIIKTLNISSRATSISHLPVHEEAQCERDSHGSVSKLLFTAHGGGGGGVVGGGVGGLCRWETHEGPRPRGVWSCPEHHREPFGEPGEEPLESPGAVGGVRGGRVRGWTGGWCRSWCRGRV